MGGDWLIAEWYKCIVWPSHGIIIVELMRRFKFLLLLTNFSRLTSHHFLVWTFCSCQIELLLFPEHLLLLNFVCFAYAPSFPLAFKLPSSTLIYLPGTLYFLSLSSFQESSIFWSFLWPNLFSSLPQYIIL